MSETTTLSHTKSSAAKAVASPRATRKRLLIWLGLAVAAGALAFGVWWLAFAGKTVSTNDAYVGADTAEVTPLVAGPVVGVLVRETAVVRTGDTLVTIDPADTRIAVDQAEAALGQAVRRVLGYGANDVNFAGQLSARAADIVRAKADLERARIELGRREALSASGAVSGDELTIAKNAFATAQAGLAQAEAGLRAAQGAREANSVLISGVSLEKNPEVAAARARLAAAELALSRTVIRAPIDGVVSDKQVQVGQQAEVGVPLMSIVPIANAYVDANFKEVQLAKVRAGQPVELTSDLYGGKVKFRGRVVGLWGGTGSAFSLIPAQNASGNWIKVVQRLPVRIQLDRRDLEAHPLRIGLSMNAAIDVSGAR